MAYNSESYDGKALATARDRNIAKLLELGIPAYSVVARTVQRWTWPGRAAENTNYPSTRAARDWHASEVTHRGCDPTNPAKYAAATRRGLSVIRMDEHSRSIRIKTPGVDWHVHGRYPDCQALFAAWRELIQDGTILEG